MNSMQSKVSSINEPFSDAYAQREAAELGMWTFLATEALFFGGLFLAYGVYRHLFPSDFVQASAATNGFLGAVNTAILLTSSFTMAQGVNAIETGRTRQSAGFVGLTVALGLAFLCIKSVEYVEKIERHLIPGPLFDFPQALNGEMFFYLYFVMTGLHALHVIGGVCALTVIMRRTWKGCYSARYHTPVVIAGLYWHFVDIVWIFLFPLLYLIGSPS